MNTYEYHELHNEEPSRAAVTDTSARNVTLVWVDEEATMDLSSSNSRTRHTIHMFREINGDKYKLYNEIGPFLNEIQHLCRTLDLLVILSGTFADIIIRNLTELSLMKEIGSIVIFCTSSYRDSYKPLLQHRKVMEICDDQSSLKAAIENEKHSSANFVICDRHLKSLFNLEKEFEVYSWYKKYMDILTDNYESNNKREKMLTLCSAWYETNGVQMAQIRNFDSTYLPENAARWYAKDCFLYRVVNKALRTLDMETINAFRFYIKDLSQQLEELHKLQKQDRVSESIKVYRGYANMTTLELNKIRQNIGGLISFNGFVSTTTDPEVALAFALSKTTHESVIFQIQANYNLETIIFADITQYSDFHENEILFGLCSVFKITNFFHNENNRVTIIEMSATDEDAQNFQNYVQEEAEVVVENKKNRLLHCIHRYHRYQRIILGSIVVCLIIASIVAVIVGRYMPSKRQISNFENCVGTNCTTFSTSTDESTVAHNTTSPGITKTTRPLTTTFAPTKTTTTAATRPICPSTMENSRWSSTDNMITPRSKHTASLLGNGKVLVAGGIYLGRPLKSAELYDPSAGTWIITDNMTDARHAHTASVLNNGKVLVTGGLDQDGLGISGTELYDLLRGSWTPSGKMISARSDHTASVLSNGKVLLVGGTDRYKQPLNSAELYDSVAGTWTNTGNMTRTRFMHTASVLSNGKVLVAGGLSIELNRKPSYMNSTELYDPVTGTWTATSDMIVPRGHHTASVLNNGKVLVTGGVADSVQESAELYDLSAGFGH